MGNRIPQQEGLRQKSELVKFQSSQAILLFVNPVSDVIPDCTKT